MRKILNLAAVLAVGLSVANCARGNAFPGMQAGYGGEEAISEPAVYQGGAAPVVQVAGGYRYRRICQRTAFGYRCYTRRVFVGGAVVGATYGGATFGGNAMRRRRPCSPGSTFIAEVDGCVTHVTDPAALDAMSPPIGSDPRCRGKSAGYSYDVPVYDARGRQGVGHRICGTREGLVGS